MPSFNTYFARDTVDLHGAAPGTFQARLAADLHQAGKAVTSPDDFSPATVTVRDRKFEEQATAGDRKRQDREFL